MLYLLLWFLCGFLVGWIHLLSVAQHLHHQQKQSSQDLRVLSALQLALCCLEPDYL